MVKNARFTGVGDKPAGSPFPGQPLCPPSPGPGLKPEEGVRAGVPLHTKKPSPGRERAFFGTGKPIYSRAKCSLSMTGFMAQRQKGCPAGSNITRQPSENCSAASVAPQ